MSAKLPDAMRVGMPGIGEAGGSRFREASESCSVDPAAPHSHVPVADSPDAAQPQYSINTNVTPSQGRRWLGSTMASIVSVTSAARTNVSEFDKIHRCK